MIDTEIEIEHPLPPDTLGEPPTISLPAITDDDPPTPPLTSHPPG